MASPAPMFPELAGGDFEPSDEVEDVARAVLRLHGNDQPLAAVVEALDAREMSIAWLVNHQPVPPAGSRHDAAGKCVKAPTLWRDVTGTTYAIWVRASLWDAWDQEMRRAVVLHELLHVEVTRDRNNQPVFGTRKHDVEGFVGVARLYGPVEGRGAEYVRAATLRGVDDEPGDPPPAGRTVDPETGEILDGEDA